MTSGFYYTPEYQNCDTLPFTITDNSKSIVRVTQAPTTIYHINTFKYNLPVSYYWTVVGLTHYFGDDYGTEGISCSFTVVDADNDYASTLGMGAKATVISNGATAPITAFRIFRDPLVCISVYSPSVYNYLIVNYTEDMASPAEGLPHKFNVLLEYFVYK